MRHWFKDQHFRSLLKNSSYLAISRGVAAVCSLATLAFAGRGLGVILFGTLILITSYAKAASGISKFQSWQLVVRYGGQGLAAGDPEKFKTSTGFAFALDVLSGVARDDRRRRAPAVASAAGSASSRNICGWRCSTAPCCRRWARRPPAAYCGRSTASTCSAGRAR